SEKLESVAMFRPVGDVRVVSGGGGLVLVSLEPPQARAATAVATRTRWVRGRVCIPQLNPSRLVRARHGSVESASLTLAPYSERQRALCPTTSPTSTPEAESPDPEPDPPRR